MGGPDQTRSRKHGQGGPELGPQQAQLRSGCVRHLSATMQGDSGGITPETTVLHRDTARDNRHA